MYITDFTENHIELAIQVAKQNYDAQREIESALPPVDIWPDMHLFAENRLGVAAFEGEEMLGFLCCFPPFKNAFRSTNAVGVFSPMHGNGAVIQNRGEVYARMYQAAAEKWAKAGASSHAICLYAHDIVAQEKFFYYGFGMRCLDAIRSMEGITVHDCPQYTYHELPADEYMLVYPLYAMLGEHMASSPSFIVRPYSQEAFCKSIAKGNGRYFIAKKGMEIVAFLKINNSGETFITQTNDMLNVDGAFCMPKHRGTGVYPNLLNYAICNLKAEGFKLLGVDFESINPTAYRFWLKYFSAYTHSVVRRIDEHSIRQ